MKCYAIINKGFEEEAALEIKEITKSKVDYESEIVLFEVNDYLSLCNLCYQGRSFSRAGILLKKFKINDIEDIKNNLSDIDFKDLLKNSKGFAVRAKHDEMSPFSVGEVEPETGAVIIDSFDDEKPKVNLTTPDLMFYCFIVDDIFYFGIDFCGFDLSKRDYKIFGHKGALNGSVAQNLIGYSNYDKEKIILDPFCGSGTICIEAAMKIMRMPNFYYKKEKFIFQKIPFLHKEVDKIKKMFENIDNQILKLDEVKINGYDNLLASLKSSQKNAKIAGVSTAIRFSKCDIDWLDTKFDEKSIDLIITFPPQESNRTDIKKIRKTQKEFFFQSEYILKENGEITLITLKKEYLIETAKEQGFFLISEKEVYQGKQRMFVLRFKKKTSN